jgi:TatD DNase family protein
MFIDTHTHLYSEEFNVDKFECIDRAIENGVSKFYMPNVDIQSIESMLDIEARYPNHCFAMMGLHPCSVNETYEKELATIKQWLDKRKFIAIGEIGLDLHWDKTFITQQEICLKQQLQWALDYNYTVVIHCRSAFDEIYNIFKSFKKLPKGIFHCFSGDYVQAQKILELGNFKIGIGGVVTFKNSGLDKVVEQLSLTDIVLETDAPYLAPVPYRGKRNESGYLPIIAKVTTQNAISIFEN